MAILNGLNIRKGLEFEEVTVHDIFLPNLDPQGDKIVLEIYVKGWDGFILDNPSQNKEEIFGNEEGIAYITKKIPHKISDNLTAYVSDCYMAYIDEKTNDVICEKSIEIEFVNSEKLDIPNYCKNVMLAQNFCGKYEDQEIKFSFVGFGGFSMEDYAELHNMVIFSKMHMLDFFIFYKGILSSIGFFLTGLFEEDVKQQKEYLTLTEYNELIKECRKHRRMVNKELSQLGSDFEGDREEF